MRTIETKVYRYSELSDAAKEKARDWLRNAQMADNYFAEYVTDDFHETLKALGFVIDNRHGVAWSGFSSQGDGASFTGEWRASLFAPDELLADRPAHVDDGSEWARASDGNRELHRIAGELRACVDAGMAYASVSGQERWGFHMSVGDAEHNQPEGTEEGDARDVYVTACAETEDRFITAARGLAHAFYKTLEAEYEYQNSDEQIAECIEANEYEFTEEGKRS